MLTPVRLPPGRERLATRPSSTGSVPRTKAIGMVAVAAFAAWAEAGPPLVAIISTLRWIALGFEIRARDRTKAAAVSATAERSMAPRRDGGPDCRQTHVPV